MLQYTPRQIEIIKVATLLIGKKGVNSLTIKNIAKRMKFSEPAFYRHFQSKDILLKSILLYYKGDMKHYVFSFLQDVVATGLQKVELLVNFQFKHLYSNPSVVMVIFSETSFQNSKLLSETVFEIMKQKNQVVETLLEIGQMDGSIRNDISVEDLAIIILGSIRLKILHWRLSNFEGNLIEIGDDLWSSLEMVLKNNRIQN